MRKNFEEPGILRNGSLNFEEIMNFGGKKQPQQGNKPQCINYIVGNYAALSRVACLLHHLSVSVLEQFSVILSEMVQ